MYCNKCGKELKENETFCSNCGSKKENTSIIFKINIFDFIFIIDLL